MQLVLASLLLAAQPFGLIKDINPNQNIRDGDGPWNGNYANGSFFFQGITAADRYQLWQSDGTAAGTRIAKRMAGGYGVGPTWVLGDNLVFVGNDGLHGWELWRTDGTLAGTELIKDINPGSADAQIGGPNADYWLVD